MSYLIKPEGYKPLLDLKQTELGIKQIKEFFQLNLSSELRLLHTDFFHRPMSDDHDFRYGKMPVRPLFAFRLLREECRGETCCQSEEQI